MPGHLKYQRSSKDTKYTIVGSGAVFDPQFGKTNATSFSDPSAWTIPSSPELMKDDFRYKEKDKEKPNTEDIE